MKIVKNIISLTNCQVGTWNQKGPGLPGQLIWILKHMWPKFDKIQISIADGRRYRSSPNICSWTA